MSCRGKWSSRVNNQCYVYIHTSSTCAISIRLNKVTESTHKVPLLHFDAEFIHMYSVSECAKVLARESWKHRLHQAPTIPISPATNEI